MADLDLASTIPIESTRDSLDERRLRPLPPERRERPKHVPAPEEPEDTPAELDDHGLDVTA